jgi:hypothetical protein
LKLLFATLVFGAAFSRAEIVPIESTKRLVDAADLIIVGKIESVQQTGTGSISFNGVSYARQDYQATINVDETIKGEPAPSKFALAYSTPSTDSVGNVAEGGLPPNTYRVIFLIKTSTGYKFVSPYYSSLPASRKPCAPNWPAKLGEDAYHKVLQRVLDLLCTDSTSAEKQAALFAVNWDEDPSIAPFLKSALSLPEIKSSPILRTSILSDLLTWKDLSVLPLAEEDLFEPSRKTRGWLKANLVQAISNLESQISVPLLARALKLPEPEARVAAARYLEYTHSQTALDVLLSALDDPDKEVLFAAMQSLGNLTNQDWWRPNTLQSDSHWKACIEHWRQFGEQRKSVTQ